MVKILDLHKVPCQSYEPYKFVLPYSTNPNNEQGLHSGKRARQPLVPGRHQHRGAALRVLRLVLGPPYLLTLNTLLNPYSSS